MAVNAQIDCSEQPRECERAILSGQNYIGTLEQQVTLEREAKLKAVEAQNLERERADTEKKRADTLEKATVSLEKAFDAQRQATATFKEVIDLKDKEIVFQTNRANEYQLKYEKQKNKTLVARIATVALSIGLAAVLRN